MTGSYGAPDFAPLVLSNAYGYGLRIASAGFDGVAVISADNNGVYINSTGADAIFVCTAGNVIGCSPDFSNANGIEVANAEDHGIRVIEAGRAGVRVDMAGINGLYVASAGDSGIWVSQASNWAGHFGGDINVTGDCFGCGIGQMALNTGNGTLQPGDIVAMDGIAANSFDGLEMLLRVRRATPGSPVAGVVSGRAEPYTSAEDGSNTLVPRNGEPAEPGDYLSVVIYGPVQVKATGDIELGDRVTVADGFDGVRALSTFQVQRTDGGTADIVETAPVLGVALDAAHDGLVWVLVNMQ